MERFRGLTGVDKNPQRTVIIFKDETGAYVAHIPSMPGCLAQGTSRENVLEAIQEVMPLWSEAAAKTGHKPLNDSRLLGWREAARDLLLGYRPELVTVSHISKQK